MTGGVHVRKIPLRQVHLDFHTSPHIPDVASCFDKKQFQQMLQLGHVQSVTVFAKCHHGYCYYPTQVSTPHPGLMPGRDFTAELMDACHEIGVDAPVYVPMGWSALDAQEHPEWVMRNADGKMMGKNYDVTMPDDASKPETSWQHLCTASGYREHLFALTREICNRYKRLDGLFFDIAFIGKACYCESCLGGMREMGMDPQKDAERYFQLQKKTTIDGLVAILHEAHPDATVFFNTGGADMLRPQWHYASTHFEMEDLPTVWGGYDKLPMRACFFEQLDKPYFGMTGKFHRAWGEFGGFKTPEALTQECAAIMAYGAGISIGDQMHPDGTMELQTYQNIGKAYDYVQKIEAYCIGGKQTATLGVLLSPDKQINEAMTKLLLDCQLDFGVVRDVTDLQQFDTVILPDRYRVPEAVGKALNDYLTAGGKLLLLGGSGLQQSANAFGINIPFTYQGPSEYDMDFFQLTQEHEQIGQSPVLCYCSAHRVEGEGTVYSRVREPYFSRTYGKYCSHYNTPYSPAPACYPGAIQAGNVLYIAHELASIYSEYGATVHRRYFLWLLRRLHKVDPVEAQLPSQSRIHMVKHQGRYVLHLMYAAPIQRGQVSVLEDFPTLRNIPVTLHVPEQLQRAVMVPQQEPIPLERTADGWCLTVPELTGHQMIVFEYERRD